MMKTQKRFFKNRWIIFFGENPNSLSKVHLIKPKYNRITLPTGYGLFQNLTDKWLWSEYILPSSKFEEIWQEIEPLLKIKQSLMYFYIIKNDKGKNGHHTFLGRNTDPEATEPLIGFGLLYTFYERNAQAMGVVKSKLDGFYKIMIQKGGKPYYHGYHPQLKEKDMRHMYPKFDEFLALKSSLDPNGILNPGWITKDM